MSQVIWLPSLLKYIEVLTFHIPCLYDLCSRSQQLKVKTNDGVPTVPTPYCLDSWLFDSRQIERYLEPDIVLARNVDGGVKVNSWSFLVHFRLRLSLFFLQGTALNAQESLCTVFGVPCGWQDIIHFNLRSQGSRTWGRRIDLPKPVRSKAILQNSGCGTNSTMP